MPKNTVEVIVGVVEEAVDHTIGFCTARFSLPDRPAAGYYLRFIWKEK